jgi:hypothetical protein
MKHHAAEQVILELWVNGLYIIDECEVARFAVEPEAAAGTYVHYFL